MLSAERNLWQKGRWQPFNGPKRQNCILMTFITNPRRDASPTIAGFVFQVNVTIHRWLELQAGEHLWIECGEEVATVQNSSPGGTPPRTRLPEHPTSRSPKTLPLTNHT